MMPKLSGFEVCKKLKNNPATQDIMILMVTALNEPGDIDAVSAGATIFEQAGQRTLSVENMPAAVRHRRTGAAFSYIDGMEDDTGPQPPRE